MYFASDNWAGAHPAVAQSLVKAADAYYTPYGDDAADRRVEEKLSVLFEREVKVFFVGTGTAANALSLASQARPASVIFCHPKAHVTHEAGAVELATGGGKLVHTRTRGPGFGKIDPAGLNSAISAYPSADVSAGNKVAVTLSQATEIGTVYDAAEIAELADITHASGMKLHMDGARFANAVAALGISPAEMTWRAGVDILSLGGTKNGCWCAEAVVFFNPDDAVNLPVMRKRAGHLFSKTRFISAQFEAWLEDDLWLDLARHANRLGGRLADAVRQSRGVRLAWETGSNQQFVVIPDDKAAMLRAAGASFHDWPAPEGYDGLAENERIRRLIASFATSEDDVDRFAAML